MDSKYISISGLGLLTLGFINFNSSPSGINTLTYGFVGESSIWGDAEESVTTLWTNAEESVSTIWVDVGPQ